MIPLKELKQDNWVLQKGQPIQIAFCSSVSANYFFSDFEPIPLTSEILEKCGFKKDEDHCNYWRIEQNDEWKSEFKIYGVVDETYHFKVDCGGYWYGILSLHHLQNLYSVLTGEELVINL